MHFVGLAGLPRRYYANTAFPLFDDVADVNIVITLFAILGGAAQLIFLTNFFMSIYKGKKAEQNPWKANTLELTTPIHPGNVDFLLIADQNQASKLPRSKENSLLNQNIGVQMQNRF